jgi:uncharacterized repeat protein (TIGR03803 family)
MAGVCGGRAMKNRVVGWRWISGVYCRAAKAALILVVALAAVTAAAQAGHYKVLYYFTGGADGAYPQGHVVLGKNGAIYGAALFGGNTSCAANLPECGEVFEVDKAGKETVLYGFTGGNDGAGPFGSLIQDSKGNLYGTTLEGGSGTCEWDHTVVGCGTVFKLSPPKEKGKPWTEKILYSFQGSDGEWPYAGLVQDASGNLFGTTSTGGAGNCGGYGCGTVFELDNAGTEKVLYSFAGGADGYLPFGGLTLDAAGNLYGVTNNGGDLQDCGNTGCGVVFGVSKSGKESVLYSFTGTNGDGQQPMYVTLVRDSVGNLYGTTEYGGTPEDGVTFGTVFKVTPKGKETVLYSFQGFLDGGYPLVGLVADPKGNLYGSTWDWGKFAAGTLFEITKSGSFKVLHQIQLTDGDGGYGALTWYPDASPYGDGSLYGAGEGAGDYRYCGGAGCGTVFKLTP